MADLSSYINITANTVVTSNLSATGNVVSNSVISTTGNITGNYILGNGSQLTGLPATYGNSNVTTLLSGFGSNTISTTGNINGGNLVLNGNLTVNGSPIYGVPASYTKYTRSSQQTGLSNGSVVIFNVLENSFGSDISVNTGTGQVTLAANRTYRLVGMVPGFTTSGSDVRPQFCWYNETTSSYIGNSAEVYTPNSSAGYGAFGGPAEAVIVTNATTVVSFRLLAGATNLAGIGGNPDFNTTGSYPWIDIQVIGGQAPITGFSTAGNVTGGNVLTAGVVSAAGNVTGNYILGNGSQLTGLPATYGNSNVTTLLSGLGSNTISSTGNITTTANISGGNIIAVGTANTGISAVVAGATNTLLSNTVAGFTGNVNNYTQVTFQNKSTGTDATADFILTADNGSDATNYGDFGIINSGYDNSTPTNSLGNIVFAADTYLYAQGNTSNASQAGGNLAIGTTVPGKNVKIFAGGITNSSIIANISNTGVAVTGNVTASNFIGNISITGNVTGTSSNVSLVAGSYTYTFDNTGIVTLPAPATGNEGGEIDFGKAANSTLSGNSIVFDQYVDRFRFFEGGGTNRGVYIDFTQAAAGVGTLLNNRVSGLVNAGTFVTMDNIKATVTSSGNRGLSIAAVSTSFNALISGTYSSSGGGGGASSNGSVTYTTTASASVFSWTFSGAADTATYVLTDTTNNKAYRITMMIGGGYLNNLISIERLV